MKITVLIALILTASTIFANNKTNSRKPANAEEALCQAEAGAAAQGAVKGLGQDVTIESVKVDFIKGKYETYKIRPDRGSVGAVCLHNHGCSGGRLSHRPYYARYPFFRRRRCR